VPVSCTHWDPLLIHSSKCCLCGADIPGNGASMCNNCIINNTNMAEGIETQIHVTYCKECNRYVHSRLSHSRILTPSKHWVFVERESVEELGILLKMIKGLNKV